MNMNMDAYEIVAETLELETSPDGTETITATFWGVTLKRKVIASELARGGIGAILEQMHDRALDIVQSIGDRKRPIGVLPKLFSTYEPETLKALAGG